MKIKEIFNEEYDDTFTAFIGGKKVKINIFKNPSKKEMNAVSEIIKKKKIIKFIEFGENLYVFSPLTFHYIIIKHFGKDSLRDYPQGVAIFEKGEWIADKMDKDYRGLKKLKTNKIKV